MINTFREHILGVGDSKRGINRNPGLFGKMSTYYGIVNQQGRLALHLHMVLWISNSLTPQEIRDGIMDEDSTFHQMVQYLKGVHMGEFLTGLHQNIHERVNNDMIQTEYICPTETLPTTPPI